MHKRHFALRARSHKRLHRLDQIRQLRSAEAVTTPIVESRMRARCSSSESPMCATVPLYHRSTDPPRPTRIT